MRSENGAGFRATLDLDGSSLSLKTPSAACAGGRGKMKAVYKLTLIVNLVFSLLVLLYIWPTLIVESSDSFEKQSSIAKQPSLAEDINNIENYKYRKCRAKEQSSSTMKFYRRINNQKGWRPIGKWKIGVELIVHNQLSQLNGKFHYKFALTIYLCPRSSPTGHGGKC